MFEKYFQKSFNLHLGNDFNLVVDIRDQIVPEGKYFAKNWMEMMQQKIEVLIDAASKDEYFVFADTDILFCDNLIDDFNDFKKSGLDFSFQSNFNSADDICAGFFYCKSSDRAKKFLDKVLVETVKYDEDQRAMNKNKSSIQFNILPATYWSYGQVRKSIWDNNDFNFDWPKPLKIVHANYIIGVENKIKMLQHFIS